MIAPDIPDPHRDPAGFLRRLFDCAVAEADPMRHVARWLPEPPRGRTVVVGTGKATGAMARAVEQGFGGPLEGLVTVPYGGAVSCDHIEVVEARHPVPDEAGHAGAARILELARSLGEDDLLIALVSGGGSALLPAPLPGLSLEDKQAVNRELLRCGATIGEMNVVRKHLSAIKGGRLAAAAWPARCVTLLISDVPGDDPGTIASGPTIPDPSTQADALAIVERYAVALPDAARAALADPANESPGPGDERLARAEAHLVARPLASLEAAATVARAAGLEVAVLSDRIEGEAREVGIVHAGIALAARDCAVPVARPGLVLSGGETTVTVRGEAGRGGRNGEFALSLAVTLDGAEGIHAIACDTDGIDGSEANAGVLIDPGTLARHPAGRAGARAHLDGHDSWTFFEATGGLVTTGPTLTNVNDFRAILVL